MLDDKERSSSSSGDNASGLHCQQELSGPAEASAATDATKYQSHSTTSIRSVLGLRV